jgi:CRP-like cAMP-binding protein
MKVTLSFKKGQVIFEEGDFPEGVFLLKKGKIKKHVAANFNKTHLFYICKENE